jgi:hypothetical protein
MKRFIIAVSVVLLVFAVVAWAQTPAPKPGPEQKKCLTSARFGQGLISPKLWFPITKPS